MVLAIALQRSGQIRRPKQGCLCPQAQGLAHIMGGREWLQEVVQRCGIVLAAHGPYTAAGMTLGPMHMACTTKTILLLDICG
jgi:short subunit dehydrogenase-like uncharacterized protein